jgi:preprotein translocase subunit SecG
MVTFLLLAADAVLAVLLIAVIILQPGKSAGLGSIDGGMEAFFGGKVKGMDIILYKATMGLSLLFALVNIILAKTSAF